MANADTLKVAIVEEASWGATPVSPTMQYLRFTSESISKTVNSTRSTEITNDRQTTDIIRTDVGVEGSIGMEFSYGTYDLLLQSALESGAWVAADTATITLSGSFSGAGESVVTLTTSTGDFTTKLAAGKWIRLSGTGITAAFSLPIKLTSVAETTVTGITPYVATAETITDIEATIAIGSYITNGTTPKSFTIQKQWTDLSNAYAVITGVEVDSFELTTASEQITSGSFGIIGRGESDTTSGLSGATYNAASTTQVFDPITHVLGVLSGPNPIMSADAEDINLPAITSFSLATSNNLRRRKIIGDENAVSIGDGKFSVSGTIEAYYSKQAEYTAFLDNERRSLTLMFEDDAGNAYVIDMPSVKFSSGTRETSGENTDIMASLDYEAYKDAAEAYTMKIVKFPAV